MDIKILNSILYNELMPWMFDSSFEKSIRLAIKRNGDKQPLNETEIVLHLQQLLVNYPTLIKWLSDNKKYSNDTLVHHRFTIAFSDYSTPITKFYSKIISLEALRIYNAFHRHISKYQKQLDINYQTNSALRNIKALAIDVVKELKSRNLTEAPNEVSELTHFVLYLLRQHLTILFFDIQELSKENLTTTISIEDYYLLDLGLPKHFIKELSKSEHTNTQEVISIAKSDNKAFSFGFKGDVEKLKNLIKILCVHKNLLEETITKQEDFIALLTTKNITEKKYKIQIGCNSNLFTYIVDSLKRTLPKFSYSNIERCRYFYTDNGKPIKASLFSNSKSNNPIPVSLKEYIDNIFKENGM